MCNEEREECHVNECVFNRHDPSPPLVVIFFFFLACHPALSLSDRLLLPALKTAGWRGNRMDEEINALCIRFLNNFCFFCCCRCFFVFVFFFQRKHTHNVASQYLLSCRPACRAAGRTEQPRRRVEREIKDGRGAEITATRRRLLMKEKGLSSLHLSPVASTDSDLPPFSTQTILLA